MKIIKEGNIEKKVICSYCNCEYEYDAKDICEDYQTFDYGLRYPVNYERIVRKFVCCPECGEKYYIRKDIKPFVRDYFGLASQEVETKCGQALNFGDNTSNSKLEIKNNAS